MKNEWKIKFLITDKDKKRQHKKSRVLNIKLEVPTEGLAFAFDFIKQELANLWLKQRNK